MLFGSFSEHRTPVTRKTAHTRPIVTNLKAGLLDNGYSVNNRREMRLWTAVSRRDIPEATNFVLCLTPPPLPPEEGVIARFVR